MRVVLLHGFAAFDGGRGSVGTIEPLLRAHGHETILFPYGGLINPLAVPDRNDLVAKQLRALKPGAIVGYSNAAVIQYNAAHLGLHTRTMIFAQPAIHWAAEFPAHAGRLVCLWNPHDWVVRLARLTNPLAILQEGTWGAAGARGMKHAHLNLDTSEGPFPAKGHSAIWRKKAARDYWGEIIARELDRVA